MRKVPLAVGTVAVLVAAFGVLSLTRGAAPPAAAAGLVAYDSCAQLLAHHREVLRARAAAASGGGYAVDQAAPEAATALDAAGGSAVAGSAAAGATSAGAGAAPAAVARGGTGTNLQEQDVDEPDRAKLRDGRLLVLAQQRLTVFEAAATPTVLSSFPLDPDEHAAELLLVGGDRAVVVAQGGSQTVGGPAVSGPAVSGPALSEPSPPYEQQTRLLLFDLSDPREPELLEEAVTDGAYLSARLVDGTVRLVTRSTPQVAAVYPQAPGGAAQDAARAANEAAALALPLEALLPQVERRTGTGRLLERGHAVECGRVTRPREAPGSSTLLVQTLRPEQGLEAVDTTAVTADGDLVYASSDRLYVGTSRWGTTGPLPVTDLPRSRSAADPQEVSTELHAFDTTDPVRTTYVGSGSVDGYVLGRWALSEHEGALRVATTLQPPWGSGEATSSSVVVLRERDGALVEQGRVDGLGKTEQIKAVRYFGDLAAVVTFRQTDPLYLVDLSDEARPRVTGELKVPGFSTYLHPLGDGLLLGVGNEATDTGMVTGLQVSVFDVRDLTSPTQVDRLQLGAAHSAALDDSRAFGYDPQRRLATLPLQAWSGREASAVGIEVREDGTLREVGRLQVHVTTPPDRVLSDGERVYAVGASGVVAGDPETMQRLGAADVPR